MRQWRRALAVVCAGSGLLALAMGRVAAGPTEDALKKCLKGRCKQGVPVEGKLPDYNLGYGYTCDLARSQAYDACMQDTTKTCAQCTAVGDAKREECKKKPCDFVYAQCIDSRCKKTSNDWDCWDDRKSDGGKFGYWDYVDGKWKFIPVDGDEVPAETWKTVCEKRKERCLEGLKAEKGQKVPPIAPSFCSAKCYGHNCHHAAAEVCKCLKDERLDGARIVVFDPPGVGGDRSCLPCPPGNLYHSMITIPHPTDADKRCLIESQAACGDGKIDEKCCYASRAEFEKLDVNGCAAVRTGPLGKSLNLKNVTLYDDCSKFLEERGTCKAEVPKLAEGLGALPEEGSLPECFLTCGSHGEWREVWEDNYSPCGAGTCVAPEGATCDTPPDPEACPLPSPTPEPEPTCTGSGECAREPLDVPVYRGVCVMPSPSPTPSPTPWPTPTPLPTPSPEPTPTPTPWPWPTPTPSPAPSPSPVPTPSPSPLPLPLRQR